MTWKRIYSNDKEGIKEFIDTWKIFGCSAHIDNFDEVILKDMISGEYPAQAFLFNNGNYKITTMHKISKDRKNYQILKFSISWDISKEIDINEAITEMILHEKPFAKKKPLILMAGVDSDLNQDIFTTMLSKYWKEPLIKICNDNGVKIHIDEKTNIWRFTVA